MKDTDYDLQYTYENLDAAINLAAESGVHHGIYVQKYYHEGIQRWAVSFCDDIISKRLFPRMEEQAIMALYANCDDLETEEKLTCMLSEMIESLWNEKDTIDVLTYHYKDDHDYYGVNRKDFY